LFQDLLLDKPWFYDKIGFLINYAGEIMYLIDDCVMCGEFTNVTLKYINQKDEATLVCEKCSSVYNVERDEEEVVQPKKKFVWQEV
jgi:hypothetical protein